MVVCGTANIWMRAKSMHFEILIEDQSGKNALKKLLPKIIGKPHTWRIHHYKGIGRIPKNLRGTPDPNNQMLLNNLPKLLRGYGKTFATYTDDCPAEVIFVSDLDSKDLTDFLQELNEVLASCSPQPTTRFCIAIEEGEAWLLGDIQAIKAAYPKVKDNNLSSYHNDSICGTWEKLADAIYPGGSQKLSSYAWYVIGKVKSEWAEKICPHMDVDSNLSPSFQHFRDRLRQSAS